jgi:hypothetical protein
LILVRARLLPPFFNSGLVMRTRSDDRDVSLRVLTWYGLDYRIRRALAEAAIPIEEARTWFSVGGHLAPRLSLRDLLPK